MANAAGCVVIAAVALNCYECATFRDLAVYHGDPGIRLLFWSSRNCSERTVLGEWLCFEIVA